MVTVKESIDILKKAQEFDRELYQAKLQIQETIPFERAEIQQKLQSEKAHLKALEESFKAVQLKQKQKEGVLAEKEAQIKKLTAQLDQVKTNKEYSTLQQEIATMKADNSMIEEDILKSFDELSSAEVLVKEERERLKNVEKEFSDLEAHLAQKEKKCQDEMVELKKQRDEALLQAAPEVKDRYDIIVTKKQGMALAKVSGENCGACQLHLRAQTLNEIRLSKTMILCENCSRILYFEG